MKMCIRALLVGVVALLTLGVFTACSSSSTDEAGTTTAAPTATAAPTTSAEASGSADEAMPQKATFIAEMPEQDGHAMGMAITVEGDQVAAYACNGTDDEAWFFGTQEGGVMNLTSKFGDTMTATYNGTELAGTLTMNDQPHSFGAKLATEPAGLYTAAENGERATWIVMPDGNVMGVQNRHFDNDDQALRQAFEQQQDFQGKVRQMRLDRQLEQAPAMNMSTMEADMGGTTVRATMVTGSTRFN